MVNAVFIFNAKGDVLMSKYYRAGIKKNVSDVFRIQVINSASRLAVRLPVLTLGSTSFLYIRSDLLWLVAVARSNQDSLAILEYLYNFEGLLRQLYARSGRLTEDDVAANFVAIFDILDELLEFGCPTSLEPSYLASVVPGLAGVRVEQKRSAALVTSLDQAYDSHKVSWRDHGIKYRKNEIYLNVTEKVHVLMDGRGELLRAHIDGAITMKAHVSGMPVCRFAFSEDDDGRPMALDDFKFHKCVDLAKYDTERVIRFVPPDGSFQLMSYHIADGFALPFRVYPRYSDLALHIRLVSHYSSKLAATNVVLRVDVPSGVAKNAVSCSNGKAKFDPQENKVVWKFSKFFGDQENTLSVDVDPATKPKITLDFNIDMHSASGLQVKLLNVVEKANYRTIKWVRYSTQSGSYEVRL